MTNPFEKLRQSLVRTKENLLGKLSRVVARRRIDDELLDEIEQILIEADVGVKATMRLIAHLRERAKEMGTSEGDEVIALLREEITAIVTRPARSTTVDDSRQPAVWLIVGVNGGGKTTTIGKLATRFSSAGKKVMIAACDTFRAAAVDQIAIWAERSRVDIVKSAEGSDPAAVAFDAAQAAAARSADILLVDTAGRLHTKSNLMEELKKIRRVVGKALPDSTISCKLIIDGSTGQNAVTQAQVFSEAIGCDGIIVTKLDGTAKGGVIIAIAEELGLPVDFIGLGEGIDDLQPFDPDQFARALLS
ncbi:MAG: signal recognition particle-docking protein FtsY [bacterium]